MSDDGFTGVLQRTLRELLGSEASIRRWSGEGVPPLRADEATVVARAVEARRTEFARGRETARAALADLGAPTPSIPAGPGGEPLWPRGFVGSISHCEGLVVSVAARTSSAASIGLDVEVARPLPAETRPLILLEREMVVLGDPLLETVVFSAKEAVHKALYPVEGIWLDFADVLVGLEPTAGGAGLPREGTLSFRPAPGATTRSRDLDRLSGRYAVGTDFVGALCYLPPPGSRPTSS